MSLTKRVVSNTSYLYLSKALSIVLSLYSTKIIFEVLGVKDFGLFNLILGVVAVISFLRGTLSATTQRYISYEIGKKNFSELSSIFSSSIILNFAISVLIVLLLEFYAICFLEGSLNIPEDRLYAGKFIFQVMIIDSFLLFNYIAYEGILNSYERIKYLSINNFLEIFLKFCAAMYLYIADHDKLITYSVLLVLASLFTKIIGILYCNKTIAAARLSIKKVNSNYVKQMLSFSSWNTFGALCTVSRSQGIAILLNNYSGVSLNAAYGIANQVSSQLTFFSQAILLTLRPQIVKSEGDGNRSAMILLAERASKYSFVLLLFLAIPMYHNLPVILKLWLSNVPDYAIEFTRLIIIYGLLLQMSVGLMSIVQAIGKIKLYQIIVGTTMLITLPLGYIALKLGYHAPSVLVVSILIEIIAAGLRLKIVKEISYFSIKRHITQVFLRCSACLLISYSIFQLISVTATDIPSLIMSFGTSAFVNLLTVYIFVLSEEERHFLRNSLQHKLKSKQSINK